MSSPTMPEPQKQLSIVMPSFRDERILEAIMSVRSFDDAQCTRIIVIDGGSDPDLVLRIAALLAPEDLLVSEPDRGIFDGLNKGLDRVDTPYAGWLGSDDLYSGAVRSSDVIRELQTAEVFVVSMAFFRGERIRRITHAWPSAHGLVRYGLHNPHYGTFGCSTLFKSERFTIDDPIADQIYFFKIFDRASRIAWTQTIGVLAGEGGFSNASYRRALKMNRLLFSAYRRHGNLLSAVIGTTVKVGYKSSMRLYYKMFPAKWPDRFPIARQAVSDARSLRAAKAS